MSLYDAIRAFDVATYLGAHGRVTKSGPTNSLVHPCPLCGSKEKRFYVNTTGRDGNGLWNSYCCHRSGRLTDLIADVEGISLHDADILVQRMHEGEDDRIVPVETPQVEEVRPTLDVPDPLYAATPDYAVWIKDRWGTLEERGVTQAIIDRHHLRVTVGLTTLGGRPRRELDHRLVVPVFGFDGLISWQARDLTGKAERRYLFPMGDRSTETLYDVHAHADDTLLIVEGVFHKWAWDALPGFERRAVASFGKKLTDPQMRLVVEHPAPNVVIGWDLDAAPQILKIADQLNGRKRLWVMPAHESGRDHDELTPAERVALYARREPWSIALGVKLTTSLALGRM